MSVSVVFYKNLGVSNAAIAFFTSWLISAVGHQAIVESGRGHFENAAAMDLGDAIAAGRGLAGVALTIPAPHFLQWTIVFFWLLAFSSATHDIAADGFYMMATTEHEQSFFIGFRSIFYRVGNDLPRRADSYSWPARLTSGPA